MRQRLQISRQNERDSDRRLMDAERIIRTGGSGALPPAEETDVSEATVAAAATPPTPPLHEAESDGVTTPSKRLPSERQRAR